MSLTKDQLAMALDRVAPGARYTRYDDYAALVQTWESNQGPPPSEATLQSAWTAYAAEQAQAEGRRTLEVEGGIGALIASLENEDYDRDLEPAKVRLALALLTKRLIDPTPIVVTAEQLAALENGIVRLFAHLSPG